MPRSANGAARSAPRRYASVQAVAAMFDVDPMTVRRWIASGLVHGYRIGDRLVKLDLDEVRGQGRAADPEHRRAGGGACEDRAMTRPEHRPGQKMRDGPVVSLTPARPPDSPPPPASSNEGLSL